MNGLLLVNVGTPEEPKPAAVRRYLREFLSDPRVLDMNPASRWLLLNLIILPRRSGASAEAYAKVWDPERGSPLYYHGIDLAEAVQQRLGDSWMVRLAMRYGQPSIANVLGDMREAGVDQLTVLPLYPQNATSTTESSEVEVHRHADAIWTGDALRFIPPFYATEEYLGAFERLGRPVLEREQPDHVLFSFHGLPERHVRKADRSGSHCLAAKDCCAAISEVNRDCYRAQCMETARRLAARLDLKSEQWSTTFQSRLGRAAWIGPETQQRLIDLGESGTGTLVVFCPAFVADCLETLEEIGIRGAETFTESGGGKLVLVPSLNSSPQWADGVARLAVQPQVSPTAETR